MTRREIIAAIAGAALVAAANHFGGPIGGKVAEKTIVPVVQEKILKSSALPGDPPPPTFRPYHQAPTTPDVRPWTPDIHPSLRGRVWTQADMLRLDRYDAAAKLEVAYYRALFEARVFPITRHEAYP